MILKVENLKKSFSIGKRAITIDVLKDINFEVKKGQTVAILGNSGSGKSTLLSIIGGLDRADGGHVQFLGKDLGLCSEKELTQLRADSISIIFQEYHLLPHLTALENVEIVLELQEVPEVRKTALRLLNQVDLQQRASHFPVELSGGEQQRVAIARSLANNPTLLLADEPSGSLDQKTGTKVIDLFFHLVKERQMTLILVTHGRELAKRCDHIFHLEEGILKPQN
jgi:putative ABC transport system ATP-binding protein